MIKLILTTIFLLGSLAYGNTIKMARTLPGPYQILDEGLEYNFQGRYYLKGAGHFFAEHGMMIDTYAFNPKNKNSLSAYIKMVPSYLTYKLLKSYESIENSIDLDHEANKDLLGSPNYQLVKKHLRQNIGTIGVGDIFIGPKTRFETINSNNQNCKISYGAILEVSNIKSKYAKLKVANMMYSKYDIADYQVCSTGTIIKVNLSELLLFNQNYIESAYKRNYLHQNKILSLLGTNRFVKVDDNKSQICSGSPSGNYSKVVNKLVVNIGPNSIENISTQGSVENILNIKRDICDYALVQSDVLQLYKNLYNDVIDYDIIDKEIYQEKGLLFCKKSSKIDTLNEIDASHTIAIGKASSGSHFTFNAIKKTIRKLNSNNKNLIKVRTLTKDNEEALKLLLKRRSSITCMFTVTRPDSNFIKKVLKNAKYIKLIGMNLPYEKMNNLYGVEAISNSDLIKIAGDRTIKTLTLSTVLIKSIKYKNENLTSDIRQYLETRSIRGKR